MWYSKTCQCLSRKNRKERHNIERKYYRYLADLIVETIKMITVSEKQNQQKGSGYQLRTGA
jgi:hypothetical protein